MKRTPLKKKSKSKVSTIQRKLWVYCKLLTREKHGNVCYTCGMTGLVGKNWHTGHMWAKASLGASLKYDLRVLRPQCYKCNMNYGGMGAEFYKRMLRDEGEEYMAKLEKDRQIITKAYDHYVIVLEEYKQLVDKLEKS